ncbi:TIGR01458 family HAD-type hydrolase [Psychromarinibacter sp. C21-152]|uniref:Haloacid dehalogenase-like hydrolase domain-containing protein 2 n=1 Tax=Psychromarinibacter sediminicola TaxID=3033385 RepID=A0AAE3T982_9RHOB|nr:TIGR01458 family HAD-type hydrolase [Psychromarinibacter sediminicola]MDF0601583.1 TIGR01458 family HAD-type hydrolase [Psychromarinibacter sediminicola]
MARGILLDIAGLLHDGGTPIPGAAEAVARLRAAGLPVRFLTNTTSKPKRAVLEQIAALGIDVEPEDVFTPAQAARDRLIAEGRAPHLLIHPDLAEDFEGWPEDGPKTVVVGDAGRYFTYEALNAAFRVLAEGAPFLALAANRVFRDGDGALSMDAGAFVKALEYASGTEAVVLGKPAPAFFAAAAESMGCALDDTAMIGDDAEADVAGALRAGVGTAVLVRTGKFAEGDETAHEPAPSQVADDLAAAVDWLLE